jgi:hypothetical protein
MAPQPGTSDHPAAATDKETLRRTERWFVRQGIPHFIEDYRSRTHILPRMLPFMIASVVALINPLSYLVDFYRYAVLGTVVSAAQLLLVYGLCVWLYTRAPSPWRILPSRVSWTAAVLTIVVLPIAWVLVSYSLGTLPRIPEIPPEVPMEVLAFVYSISLLAAGPLVLWLAYLITSYGLVPLSRRMLVQALRELSGSLPLHARAMPILLLANVFLFFTNELWQVANVLPGWKVGVLIGVFALLSVLVISTGVREEMSRIQRTLSADHVSAGCAGTPLERRASHLAAHAGFAPLRRRQELNMLMVLGARQLIQATVVALGIFLFFVVLGLIALDHDVVAGWIGEAAPAPPPGGSVEVLLGLTMPGWILTMIKFAGALAAFSAFSFVITTVSDTNYRTMFFAPAVRELERWLAVRAAYQVLHGRTESTRERSFPRPDGAAPSRHHRPGAPAAQSGQPGQSR